MKTVAKIAGAFISFFFALVGAVSIARSLEVIRSPLVPAQLGVACYLKLHDMVLFYFGCALLAASLTFIWSQRCKPN